MKINSFAKFLLKKQIKGYVPKHNKSLVNFSSLENPLGFSPKVKKLLKNLNVPPIDKYPDKSCSQLKKGISQWLDVSVENISIGNGSDELIDLIPRVLIDPKESVITQVPTFFRVIEASLKMKASVKTIEAREEDGFALNNRFVNKMIKKIKKCNPKIIWLCTPCNPTGKILTLDKISKIASETNGVVVVDEVYQEIFDPENKLSAINLVKKFKNLLVLKSFSKAFGLAGIRVGFVIGDQKIIEVFEKLRLNFNVNFLSQKIAECALKDLDFIKNCALYFKKERKWLFPKIKKLKNIKLGANSEINVFILKHRQKDIFTELLNLGILTADFRNANGLEGKGFVRIAIRTKKENQLLLKALEKLDGERSRC